MEKLSYKIKEQMNISFHYHNADDNIKKQVDDLLFNNREICFAHILSFEDTGQELIDYRLETKEIIKHKNIVFDEVDSSYSSVSVTVNTEDGILSPELFSKMEEQIYESFLEYQRDLQKDLDELKNSIKQNNSYIKKEMKSFLRKRKINKLL